MTTRSVSARSARYALLMVLGACFRALPRPTPLGPTRVVVHRTPAEVVRIASQVLAAQRFEIATSDAAAGSVVASRARSAEEQDGDIACDFPHGSAAARNVMATLRLRLNAHSTQSGSEVILTSSVRTISPQLSAADTPRATGENECVSTGAVEQRITDALRVQ